MLNIGIITPDGGCVCMSLCVCAQNEFHTSTGKTFISDKLHAYANKSSGR